jgi:hypothetical protein
MSDKDSGDKQPWLVPVAIAVLSTVSAVAVALINKPQPTPPSQGNTTNSGSPTMSAMESDIDRPGLDYLDFNLDAPDPAACLKACANDPKCKAWTYVRPNTTQGSSPRCWLKHTSPSPNSNPCCVSGFKVSSTIPYFFERGYQHGLTIPLHTDRTELVG